MCFHRAVSTVGISPTRTIAGARRSEKIKHELVKMAKVHLKHSYLRNYLFRIEALPVAPSKFLPNAQSAPHWGDRQHTHPALYNPNSMQVKRNRKNITALPA